jgi:hypothetical protein
MAGRCQLAWSSTDALPELPPVVDEVAEEVALTALVAPPEVAEVPDVLNAVEVVLDAPEDEPAPLLDEPERLEEEVLEEELLEEELLDDELPDDELPELIVLELAPPEEDPDPPLEDEEDELSPVQAAVSRQKTKAPRIW